MKYYASNKKIKIPELKEQSIGENLLYPTHHRRKKGLRKDTYNCSTVLKEIHEG